MELDQNKTFAELAIEGFGNAKKTENKDTELVVDYLLRSHEIDYSGISEDGKSIAEEFCLYYVPSNWRS